VSSSPNADPATTSADEVPHSRDVAAVPLAVFLWVVVVLGLAYGVIQTPTKSVALFG
jgi:hypothetical protein